MNNFSTDFSEIRLLSNSNINFWNEEIKFELIPMKVKDILLDLDLIWFLNFLQEDLEPIQKSITDYEIETHFDFIRLICALGDSTKESQLLTERFLYAMQKIVPKITLVGKVLMIEDKVISNSMFYEITVILFKIMHQKEPVKVIESDDEMTKRMKEMRRKVQEIKTKGKKLNENSTKFEDVFAALLYEFPQYRLEDLFELNIYTFYYLFKYVGKIANYEVSKVAAGNGLTKKHKYFIEK